MTLENTKILGGWPFKNMFANHGLESILFGSFS